MCRYDIYRGQRKRHKTTYYVCIYFDILQAQYPVSNIQYPTHDMECELHIVQYVHIFLLNKECNGQPI